MNKKPKYYIDKKNKVKEMVFIRQDTDKLYLFIPKRQNEEEIKVSSILITSPQMIETIVKKKIELKISKYLKLIEMLEDETDPTGLEKVIADVEKFRMKLINEYIKFLGKSYREAVMTKIEDILKELRNKVALNKYIGSQSKGKGR